jgi:hypothetical protein
LAFLVSYITYNIGFALFGFSAIYVDSAIREDSCGLQTHVFKYTLANSVFTLGTLVTFAFFPSGGDGARARALSMTILHFALCVWGALMWNTITDACLDNIQIKYSTMFAFQNLAVCHNAVWLAAMVMHELYLGEKFGDMTLLPEFNTTGHRITQQDAYSMGPDQFNMKAGHVGGKEPSPELSELVGAAHQSFMNPAVDGKKGKMGQGEPI